MIDAIVRDYYKKLGKEKDENTTVQFYADDGFVGGSDYVQVQKMMDLLAKKLFIVRFRNECFKNWSYDNENKI